jgi:NAD(P)-dependent dehydrogenase (short-subunit alcohol dehydrogenase family)
VSADWLGLEGKHVLIAGGAGTLGQALVTGYEDAGACVTVLDLQHGDDLSSADGARAALAKAEGEIDVLVHAVGINNRKPIEDYSDDEWESILGVNLSSAFYLIRAIAPRMRDNGGGRIVLFSSVAGRSGHKLHGPYAATKGAINQLTRVTAHEYAEHGVTVNAVAPGYMDTELTRAYLDANPEKREALVNLIPAKRFGALDEVVGPVLFLSSQQAGFITGHVLYIDGGRSIV